MPIATLRRCLRLPSARASSFTALLALTAPWAPAADWVWSSGPFVAGTTAPQPMPAGDTLFVLPGGDKVFDGVAFETFGAVSWGDQLTLRDGAAVVNRGLWDAIGDFHLLAGDGAASSFVNHGTLRKSAGSGSAWLLAAVGFVNHGTIAAFSGEFTVHGGSFEAGSRFVGSGIVRVLTGSVFRGTLHSDNLVLDASVTQAHHGEGATIHGRVTWLRGSLSGTWAVASGQVLAVPSDTGATKRLVGGSTELLVEGRLAWNAPATLSLEQGARLVNAGLFELDYAAFGNVGFGGDGSAGNALVNAATGTLRMVPATLTLTVAAGAGFVNAGGTLDTLGTVLFSGGSRFEHGTRFSGSGQVVADGHNVFAGAFDSANLALRGGTHEGEGALARGTVVWTGGDLTGTWTVDRGATLLGQALTAKVVRGAQTVLVNEGLLRWEVEGLANGLLLADGATLLNRGTLDFAVSGAVTIASESTAPVHFVNEGLVLKSGGAGNSHVAGGGFSFRNLGTMTVLQGSLTVASSFVNEGTLSGIGRYISGSSSGTLRSAGVVAPGASIGTLTVGGSYQQFAAGTLAIELASLASHDLLVVDGSVALDGTLALHCFAACHFDVGDEITVLQYGGSRNGSAFAALTLTGFASGAFDTLYDDDNLRVLLRVTEAVTPVPEPGPAALLLAGLAVLGWVARRRPRA